MEIPVLETTTPVPAFRIFTVSEEEEQEKAVKKKEIAGW